MRRPRWRQHNSPPPARLCIQILLAGLATTALILAASAYESPSQSQNTLAARPTAKTVPLKSFSYMSIPIECNGKDQLLPFDAEGHWKMAPDQAKPGAGEFPSGNFYLRKVSLSHSIEGEAGLGSYAVVGHSGPNGDWVSPMIVGTGHAEISFDPDAAPLFTSGEYFDLHTSCASGRHWGSASFWYVPANGGDGQQANVAGSSTQ